MKNVTIIVPVYNAEKYIGKCLDSILSQTYQDFEILVVNDGSDDNSQIVINKYKEKYPDKIVCVEQENKGVAVTRNESIKRANSKYIMFMDNDDYIDRDYIETYVKEIESKDYDAVVGGYERISEKGKVLRVLKLKNEEWCKLMILTPWAKIYKRQYLIDNCIEFLNTNLGEDMYFCLKALLLSDRVKVIENVGYNWLLNTKSVSNANQKDITQLQVYELLNSCYDMLKNEGILYSHYEMIEAYFIRYIVWLLSFSTKKLSYKKISQEYDKIYKWMEEKFPNYKKNKLIGFNSPKGEVFGVRFLVKIFMIGHKLHIAKLMVYFYSKI